MGVDTFLDMGRSATNVVGNSIATAVVAKWEGDLRPEEPGLDQGEDARAPATDARAGGVSAMGTATRREFPRLVAARLAASVLLVAALLAVAAFAAATPSRRPGR